MATFSEAAPGRTGQVSLFAVDGRDLEIGADDEEIEFAAGRLSLSRFEDDSGFEECRGGNKPGSCARDGLEESLSLWLAKKNGDEGGRVNHQVRSPGEPMVVVAKNFIGGARVHDRKLVHALQNLLKLVGDNSHAALLLKSLEAFFQGFLYRSGDGFSGLGGDLPGQTFGFQTLDTKRHMVSSIP